ncbi:MAG: hypothetical protein U0L33_02245 [Acutalibacteraceae bacterium]|nr:hypothetical protein [Acutalibacteraceae bacterium]
MLGVFNIFRQGRLHVWLYSLHESRNLKQARPQGQYVDLLRKALATPS